MELDKSPWGVRLNADDMDNIRNQIYSMLNGVIDRAERDAGYNSQWLKGKRRAREYLDNISERKFEELNIPYHLVNGIYYYSKDEINKHIFEMY